MEYAVLYYTILDVKMLLCSVIITKISFLNKSVLLNVAPDIF